LAGTWHNEIVQILRELCEESVKVGMYKKVCDGNSDPIPVSYKKQIYFYQPDLYGVYMSDEKIDVYEVIDAESEGDAVMDIIYSALTPRINALCVVCSDDSKLEAIKTHARIILNKIFDENKKSYIRIFRPKYFIHVPRYSRLTKKTRATMKRQIKTAMQF